MQTFPDFASRSIRLLSPAVLALLALAGCGGGGDDGLDAAPQDAAVAPADDGRQRIAGVAGTNTLVTGAVVPGYPHKVDVYRPAGATRAVVFLHGHGGRNWQVAADLGLNKVMQPVKAANVNWDWLSRNGIIAVFPQGQSKLAAGLPTWSNYVFDSGQNDVAFLGALSSFVKAQYGATEVSLSGHSSGGSMTARMWCEGTPAFKSYFSIAGPMASSTRPVPSPTCTPVGAAPYAMIVGGSDTKLSQFAPDFFPPTAEQMAAGLTDTVLTYEWSRHEGRARGDCGETPVLANRSIDSTGETWTSCAGKVRFQIVTRADHPVASIEQYAGFKLVDAVAAFVKQ